MELFLNDIFSFPTVIFTLPLIVLSLLWLMAFAGFIDLDILDIDTDTDTESDSDSSSTSWLEKLGLNGVPLTVSLTLIDLYAFAFTYLARKFFMPLLDGILTATAVGAIIAASAVIIALPITALCIKPLRGVFATHEGVAKSDLIGSICTLKTLTVSETFGQAVTLDGMVLNVRATSPNTLTKGDQVALLEYLADTDSYSVVSQAELMAMSSVPHL